MLIDFFLFKIIKYVCNERLFFVEIQFTILFSTLHKVFRDRSLKLFKISISTKNVFLSNYSHPINANNSFDLTAYFEWTMEMGEKVNFEWTKSEITQKEIIVCNQINFHATTNARIFSACLKNKNTWTDRFMKPLNKISILELLTTARRYAVFFSNFHHRKQIFDCVRNCNKKHP